MKIRLKRVWVIVLFLMFSSLGSVFSQEKEKEEEELGVQQLTIEKIYTPDVLSVVKLNEAPKKTDSITQKKEVKYTFFSVPVASTFIPKKGKARLLNVNKKSLKYNSFGEASFGSISSLTLSQGTQIALDRRRSLGWIVYYNGIFSDVPSVEISSKRADLFANVSYEITRSRKKFFSAIDFRQQKRNFYGLRAPLGDAVILGKIDAKQNLSYFRGNVAWEWYEGVAEKVDFVSNFTTDSYETSEIELSAFSKFRLLSGDFNLKLTSSLNYRTTSFKEDYFSKIGTKYNSGIGNVGVYAVSYENRFKYRVGVSASILVNEEGAVKKEEFFVYPMVNLSYKMGKTWTSFFKLEGGLKQNSFREFTFENPYIAPGIVLQSSNTPYKAKLGLRAFLPKGWTFDVSAGYEENKQLPLFRNFGYDNNNPDFVSYRYGNSFEVIYREVKATNVRANLFGKLGNGGEFLLSAQYNNYAMSGTDEKVLNLPDLQLSFSGNAKFGSRFVGEWNFMYVGERNNSYRDSFLVQPLETLPENSEVLSSYMNLSVGLVYKLTNRWDLFMEGKNLLNASEFRWAKYPVYGTTAILGLRYNFDITL